MRIWLKRKQMTTAFRLKNLRESQRKPNRRKFTLGDVAEIIGRSKTYIFEIESGRRIPHEDECAKLAQFYGFPSADVMCREMSWPALVNAE